MEIKQAPVYITAIGRTPFLKAVTVPGAFSASDLAVQAGRSLLAQQPFMPEELDEVVLGCVMPSPDEANIARITALRLQCGDAMPARTVQRNCASGLEAVDCAFRSIQSGRHDLVLAGGTEAMSRAPMLYSPQMVGWLSSLQRAKTWQAKLANIAKFRPHYLKPVIALLRGLRDPLCGLSMGQTAELLADEFNITREQMDAFAVQSHEKVIAAQAQNHFKHVLPLYHAESGKVYEQDNGARSDASMEKLQKLKPVFDRPFGLVTAGNSSQITDGAALMILASEVAVKRYQLPVLAKVVDSHWAGLSPRHMGLGPIHAATPLLQRHGLQLKDIDYWEINEAFAAQVLACQAAWQDDEYCRRHFGGLEGQFGQLDSSRLNVDGGAIALGHPIGASGARIVSQLVDILARKQGKLGVASICIGGGQGGSLLIERATETQGAI